MTCCHVQEAWFNFARSGQPRFKSSSSLSSSSSIPAWPKVGEKCEQAKEEADPSLRHPVLQFKVSMMIQHHHHIYIHIHINTSISTHTQLPFTGLVIDPNFHRALPTTWQVVSQNTKPWWVRNPASINGGGMMPLSPPPSVSQSNLAFKQTMEAFHHNHLTHSFTYLHTYTTYTYRHVLIVSSLP